MIRVNYLLRFIFIILLLTKPIIGYSQSAEWLETFGGVGNDAVSDVEIDNNEDIIIVSSSNTNFTYKSFNFSTSASVFCGILKKIDKDGNLKWAKQTTFSGTGNSINFVSVATDDSNNIYVLGSYQGNINFGNGVSITAPTGSNNRGALIKYNQQGNALWVKDIGAINPVSSNIVPRKVLVDKQNNVIAGFTFPGQVSFTGTTQRLTSNGSADIGLVKYNSNGSFLNASSYGSNSSDLFNDLTVDSNNNVFFSCYIGTLFFIGSNFYTGGSHFIFKLNSSLSFQSFRRLNLNVPTTFLVNINAKNSNKLIATGQFTGALNLGSSTLISSNGFGNRNVFIAYYNDSLNLIWAKKETALNSSSVTIPSGEIASNNGFIYFGGSFSGANTSFGSSILTYRSGGSFSQNENLFLVKMDTLGNFLWAFGSKKSDLRSMSAFINGELIISGTFTDSLYIFNQFAIGNSISDYYAAKISDFSINRGNIFPGPYCAGDSLEIPYFAFGNFDTSNFFIAEISDSTGNFDGLQRELGRIKTDTSGLIKGKLPLIDFPTNNKYRVRILSTNPTVQSFFRRDTLTFLIYSKDSADAGLDRWVCRNELIRLSTKGGSKWNWSPSSSFLNPSDSSKITFLTKLDSTTQFRVIISDTSGCGLTDTAFVTYFVRDSLIGSVIGPSSSCRGQNVKLKALITGGDSSYWYKWYIKNSSSILSNADTLMISPFLTTTYKLIFGDSCTPKIDSVEFELIIDTVIQVIGNNDSLVCKGQVANLIAQGIGCDKSQYLFSWFEIKNLDSILSNNYFFNPNINDSSLFGVILKDVSSNLSDTDYVLIKIDDKFEVKLRSDTTICLGNSLDLTPEVFSCDTSSLRYYWNTGDTTKSIKIQPISNQFYYVKVINEFNLLSDIDTFFIFVRDSLKINLNKNDTVLCIGQEIKLSPTLTGGDSLNRIVYWYDNSSILIDSGFNLNIKGDKKTSFIGVLKDNCSVDNDSILFFVNLRDSLKIDIPFSDTLICNTQDFLINGFGKGGDSLNYIFEWTQDNTFLGTGDSIYIEKVKKPILLKLLLSDNCTENSDSIEIKINVLPEIKSQISVDTNFCFNKKTIIKANSIGGDSSIYRFTWLINNSIYSNSDSIELILDSSISLKLITSDLCSSPDTLNYNSILPQPILIENNLDTSICEGQNLKLRINISGGAPNDYKINWSGFEINSSDTLFEINKLFKNPGEYNYLVNVNDNCSKPDTSNFYVKVFSKPEALFELKDSNFCPPASVRVNNLSQNSISSQWFLKKGQNDSSFFDNNPNLLLEETGIYNLFLVTQNINLCKDTSNTLNINILEKPQAIIGDISPYEVVLRNETFQVENKSINGNKFSWFIEDDLIFESNLNIDFKSSQNDTGLKQLKLIVSNNLGCSDTAIKDLNFLENFQYFVPNSFTPNNDRLNNSFLPIILGAKSYKLRIYNLWGEEVFYCNWNIGDLNTCAWDGYYKGVESIDGIYIYQISIINLRGELKLIKGSIWLTR